MRALVPADFETFHSRLVVLRISLHPGSRVIPHGEGEVQELPIWFARRGESTAVADTPIEAVEKLVRSLGGISVSDQVEAQSHARSTEPRGALGEE